VEADVRDKYTRSGSGGKGRKLANLRPGSSCRSAEERWNSNKKEEAEKKEKMAKGFPINEKGGRREQWRERTTPVISLSSAYLLRGITRERPGCKEKSGQPKNSTGEQRRREKKKKKVARKQEYGQTLISLLRSKDTLKKPSER